MNLCASILTSLAVKQMQRRQTPLFTEYKLQDEKVNFEMFATFELILFPDFH